MFLDSFFHINRVRIIKITLIAEMVFLFLLSCQKNNSGSDSLSDIQQIENHMRIQEDAWNEGDLEGFMQFYWQSDSLRFIGKSGLNMGWTKTLNNYKSSYPNKKEMGTLKFTNKSLDIIGERTIFVVGEWLLIRSDSLGDLSGMYSLIWEKKNSNWVITTDHSS